MKDKESITISDSEPENVATKTNDQQVQRTDGSSDENAEDESSSSESLLEVRLHEFVRRSELTNLDIRALVVKCSSCGQQINHVYRKEIKKHRRLGVITCKECYEFYGSSEFSQDESGYNYCTWCGNGGKLIVCDFCPNGFCGSCIRRNFGRSEISVTTKEGWKCYCCKRKRLKPKIKFCDMIIEYAERSLTKEKKSALQTITFPEEWLQIAFDDSEKASKTFQKKLSKLKVIGKNKSKSLKHVVSKLEQVIDNHRSELNKVLDCLSKEFHLYINSQKQNEKVCDNNEVEIGIENESNLIKSESPSLLNDEDEETDLKPEINNLSSHEKDQNDLSHKEKIEAKLILLQSSSESDAEGNADSPNVSIAENKSNNEESVSITENKLSNGESVSITENKLNNEESVSKGAIVNNDADTVANQAKKSLMFSDDSSDSDKAPKINKLIKHLPKIEIDVENDPKLKFQPAVYLISCDHLLPNGETFVKINIDDEEDEKLEKLIDQLCKLPSIKRNGNRERKNITIKPKSKVSGKKVEVESSSSISLSSSDDERLLPKVTPISKDVKSAKHEMSDSSSSCFVTSDSDVEKKKKSKKTKASKTKEGDSSEDFQPRKKRKFDKLLNEPVLTDEEKKSKNKANKKSLPKKRRILSSGEEEKSKEKDSNKSSDTTTSSSDEENIKNSRKKRRRVKTLGSSSDDDKTGNTPGKGRKNIQKIISQKKLAVSTQEAQQEEKERRKRIQERQKLYNKIQDVSNDGKVIITRKMVLEVDQESKEEIVEIHPDLVCKLKPHQVNGVKFMWECNIESVKDLNKPGSGCILAHCMGLGKTLQVIAFLHTCLNNSIVNKVITKAMIICPYNTALNWASEFDHWLSDVEGNVLVHQLTTCKNNLDRVDILKYWFEDGGVVIVSYDIFRRLAAEKIPKVKSACRARLHTYLLDPGPDIVVCDEGHVLKNESSAIFKATTKLRTRRRIVLTGTPLQNNLKEYHCMLSFVKPNLLGTAKEFRNRFVNPIINGQYDDSNEFDVKLMKKRIHILHKLLEGCVQRCDYSALTKFLPPKHEFVISVKLSEIQIKMYQCYLEKLTDAKNDIKCSGGTLFTDFNNLRCIWNHPYMCIKSHEKAEYKKLFKDDTDEEFINDATESSKSPSSHSESDDDKLIEIIENDAKKKTYKTRSRDNEDGDDDNEDEPEDEEAKVWYDEFISEADKFNIELSGKVVLLVEILKECEAIGDKIIVFSQSLLALDAIEEILSFLSTQPVSEADRVRDNSGKWIKGLDYFRMDGATSVDFRKNYIDMFNDPKNLRSRLFLISTRAGSLGTNLIGANRVVIFDTSWNPSHDVQAIFRVYRFGQTKPVYIYRLLAQGTMEEKIYDRQVTKLSLSYRVIDDQQIDRHFSAADLAELYTFDPNSTSNRPTPMVPRDRLLAELLIRNKDWIVTYHEHDSLLQSQTEEDLTEEERQAAWAEYENEREGRTQVPDSTTFTEDDIKTLGREPDFSNMVDYEGNMIPELKVIVSNLYERILKEMPGNANKLDFKRKLLAAVYRVRQAFQEKHVKILRMKQEFVAQFTAVPNALNKYIDELSQALKSTGEYIMKLQTVINHEDTNNAAKFQEQLKRMQQQQNIRNRTFVQNQMPGAVPQMGATRIVFTGPLPQSYINIAPRFPVQGLRFTPGMPTRMYARIQPTPKPTITEVDDNAPAEPAAPPNSSNTTSTVIIEEIS